ncbi:hypothetical protein ACFTZB_05520 [Rhodococcus sp. NPDC057014]|uniref:hypothetical protein n=1 Tax=Rhodococcus sp. NPDC057014 TaxID=3346000 RepID=UPI00363ED077
MTVVTDAHPGDGRIYLQTKGLSGVRQACPAAPEAFASLTLYLGNWPTRGIAPNWLNCCGGPVGARCGP